MIVIVSWKSRANAMIAMCPALFVAHRELLSRGTPVISAGIPTGMTENHCVTIYAVNWWQV